MRRASSSFSIYAPLKVALGYIVFTIALHLLGPWRFEDEEFTGLLLFMFLVLLGFSLGYFQVAEKWKGQFIRNAVVCERNFRRFNAISKLALLLQLIFVVVPFARDYFAGRLSIDSLLNPGQIYIDALDASKYDADTSIVVQIRTLLAPLFFLGDVYLVFNFFRVRREWRYALIVTLCLQLLYGALTKGAQKGFFDLFIMLGSVGVLRVFFDKRSFLRSVRYLAVLFVFVVGVFAFFQISRMSEYDALDFSGAYRMSLNRDSLIFTVLGDTVGLAFSLFVGYLSMGYYGLSLTLQLPFEWTYGIGNSFALMSYAEQYFGISGVYEGTYPHRMESTFGWPAKIYWHTFFPWVASDLTFPGAVILMYFVGRVLARSLIDSLVYESPLGIVVFYFVCTLVFYLPANNQLMQTREMAIGFSTLFLTWLLYGSTSRGRFELEYRLVRADHVECRVGG